MLPKFKYHRRLIFIAALLFLKDLQTFAQKEFLVTVNPSNSAVTKIDSMPGVTWIKGYETPAYCESKQRYTFIGSEDPNLVPGHLFTIDAVSGHIISNPQIDPNVFYCMQYSKSDSLLYGTIFDSGSMFLVLVNTSSGSYSIVHKIPGMFTVLKFIVDDAHNRVFLSGPDSTGYPTLMTMNLLTGEVISQVYTPRINNLLYNYSTKKFYAISNRDTTLPHSRPIFSISRIDPNTGLISLLADIPHLDNLDPGNETMDEKDNLYIFTGVETTDTSNYLYSVDVTTGKVIYKTSVPMYNVYDKDNLIEFRFDNNSQKLYALLWAGKSIEPPADSSCDLDVQTKLYPNPFGDVLIVEKTQTICRVRMNLYNALGQILIAGQLINDGKNEIHLERLSKGVYFYKFISDAKTVLSGKIIKQ